MMYEWIDYLVSKQTAASRSSLILAETVVAFDPLTLHRDGMDVRAAVSLVTVSGVAELTLSIDGVDEAVRREVSADELAGALSDCGVSFSEAEWKKERERMGGA